MFGKKVGTSSDKSRGHNLLRYLVGKSCILGQSTWPVAAAFYPLVSGAYNFEMYF